MGNNQYFSFEEDTDFPYYKNNKFLSKKEGIVLISSVLLFIFLILGPLHFLKNQTPAVLFFITLIPLLFITSGTLNTLFKKPKLKDIKIVILSLIGCFGLQFIYAVIFTLIGTMDTFVSHTSYLDLNVSLLSILLEVLQVISEELFRAFLFLIFLHLIYKYTNNRKQSIIIGTILVLLVFGLMHVNSYNNIIYCILYMGFGTFFEFYPYLKTKNVLLSIIVHLIYNLVVLFIKG